MSLENITEGDDLDVVIEQPPAVIDESLAARLVARRRHRIREQEAFEDEWDRYLAPLLLHREAVTERNRKDVQAIEDILAGMLQARQADDPKLTALHVPGATLKSRAQQPDWQYDDEFITWAETNRPLWLRYPDPIASPDKRTVKASVKLPDGRPGDQVAPVTDDGEVVPGVRVVYRPRRLVIEA